MNQPTTPNDSLVISYLALRKAVGIIGLSLPFVLTIGNMFLAGPGIESSISGYYYTGMRDVLVGSLCAIGVFLMSYRGYERKDEIAGNVAAVCAIGVALFPTLPAAGATSGDAIISKLHAFFAACFFLTLAFFALVLFRKTDPTKVPTPRKKHRNMVYSVCGYTILACIALITVFELLLSGSPLSRLDPVFWLEATAVVAFGISWLTKGEAILADD
jgi:hypothetical protein